MTSAIKLIKHRLSWNKAKAQITKLASLQSKQVYNGVLKLSKTRVNTQQIEINKTDIFPILIISINSNSSKGRIEGFFQHRQEQNMDYIIKIHCDLILQAFKTKGSKHKEAHQQMPIYLYICVFDRLKRFKGCGCTQAFQSLRDVRYVQPFGPQQNRPIKKEGRGKNKSSFNALHINNYFSFKIYSTEPALRIDK